MSDAVPDMGERPAVVVLGAPGSGKGTQGRLLASAIGGAHLSVGDLVRDRRAQGQRLPVDRQTRLIDTSATVALINDALLGRPEPSVVLDGFPRDAGQVAALLSLPLRVRGVVWLQVDVATAIGRMKCRGREGEDTPTIALRHFRFAQGEAALRCALEEAGVAVMEFDARPEIEAVHLGIASVFHKSCG